MIWLIHWDTRKRIFYTVGDNICETKHHCSCGEGLKNEHMSFEMWSLQCWEQKDNHLPLLVLLFLTQNIGFLGPLGIVRAPWPHTNGIFPFQWQNKKWKKKWTTVFMALFKWTSPFSLDIFLFQTGYIFGRTSRKCVATAT